jgi:hypothetical protein
VVFTTHPKSGKRRKNKIFGKYEDSIAKSRLFPKEVENELNGLFEGKITHLSFDCPTNLRLAFKKATKAKGSSICKTLQQIMKAYVEAYYTQKTALGNTLTKDSNDNGFSIIIEKLESNQYVQSRPRRLMRNVESELITNEGEFTCEIGNCHNEAIGSGFFIPTETEYRLCKLHYENYLNNPESWRVSE